MNYIEKVYLDKISPYLTGFVDKGNNLYNCKCTYCGDSKTNTRKVRGYFFVGTDDNLLFACRNCTISVPLGKYIQDNFPNYYLQFKLDMYGKKDQKLSQVKKPNLNAVKLSNLRVKVNDVQKSYKAVISLDDNHIAKQYLISRGLVDIAEFGYVDNFSRYVSEMTNNDSRYEKLPQDKRIIIPLKLPNGNLVGFQGRDLNPTSTLRYITIKLPDMDDDYVKIFGLDKFDKDSAGFIVEGPIDSMFLPNCISMCGTSLDSNAIKRELVIPKNIIVIIDNEARNPQIVKKMYQYAELGFRIYVPPNNLNTTQKDINQMVLAGWTKHDLVKLFVQNSYTGIKAKLNINNWKKV